MAKSFINALLSVIITYSINIAIKLLAKMAKSLPGPKTGIQMPYSTFAVVNSAKISSFCTILAPFGFGPIFSGTICEHLKTVNQETSDKYSTKYYDKTARLDKLLREVVKKTNILR